jgi:hypothetical protein
MKPHINTEKAKALSELKWELIFANKGLTHYNNGESIYRIPALKRIFNGCGFCHRWKEISDRNHLLFKSDCNCEKCEFAKAMGTFCNDRKSENKDKNIYIQWADAVAYRRGNPKTPEKLAKKILKLIQSIPIPKKK